MVRGPELLGRCRGWLERDSPDSQPLKFISAPPGLSPGSLPVAEAAPAPPHTPLSSGFFLCNLFLEEFVLFFHNGCSSSCCWGLGGFIFFFGGAGVGAILSHFCLS